jgi:biotin transport system substrate-specific component
MKDKKITTKELTLIGLMAGVTCILGPLSIPLPFSAVPISFTNLAIYFTIFLLGWKKGTISYLIYLLLGLVGLPVFSGFSGGPGKLFGPTGGYLIGFIFMAIISGIFIEKFRGKRYMYAIGMALGLMVTYLLGTAWLAAQAELAFYQALLLGVIPFIPGDILKIAAAMILGPILRKHVDRVIG